MTDNPVSDSDLLRIVIHGTTAFELLRAALQLRLFEVLEKADGMELADVANALQVEVQPARILLLGLTSLRLVRKEGDRYLNSEIASSRLVAGSQRFLGPLVEIQAEVINPAIGDFTASLQQNTNVGLRHYPGPGTTLYERLTEYPRLQDIYYRNMGDASKKSFPLMLERFDFGQLKHVLDLGGGDGSNAVALARSFPHLSVTVFDQESVVQIAAHNASKAGLTDRIHVTAGDMFSTPFPEDIDGIILFHLFEIWSLERNVELLRRCHEALPAGGAALIYTFVSNDDNSGPLSAALTSPYFLTLASGEGMTYSARDMEDVLRAAGFARIERYSNMGFHHALVAGFK